jgi:hypothetical protein
MLASALAGMLAALIFALPAQAYELDTPLVESKIEALEAAIAAKQGLNVHGEYTSASAREANARDAGFAETLLFIENTNFRFVGDIGFYVPKLSVSLIPTDPTLPVVFDDPTSFAIKPHQGSAVLSGKQLAALFNDHVFAFAGAPLRNMTLSTAQNELTLVGELMRRGKWAPFTMKGPMTLEGNNILWYTPKKVVVAGDDATKILAAASVELDDLLKIDTGTVKLIGSKIRIDANKVFPPPALDLAITSATVEPRGLVLEFNSGVNPAFPPKLMDRASYMIAKGGDVKFMRAMPINVAAQFMSADANDELDFNLYSYRDQVEQGWIQVREDGAIYGFLRNFSSLQR